MTRLRRSYAFWYDAASVVYQHRRPKVPIPSTTIREAALAAAAAPTYDEQVDALERVFVYAESLVENT